MDEINYTIDQEILNHIYKHTLCGEMEDKNMVYRFKNGQLHSEKGPAVESKDKSLVAWFKKGKLHRINGAAVEFEMGKYHMQDDMFHRIGGPAVELKNGFKIYLCHNKFKDDSVIAEYENQSLILLNGVIYDENYQHITENNVLFKYLEGFVMAFEKLLDL